MATNKPYLAAESQNTYVSWYVNGLQINSPAVKGTTNSSALEGLIDLVQVFGSIPTNLYLCAAAYITTNGGPLVARCPAGSAPNINTNEFFVIPTAALQDTNGSGTFDRLDPRKGFKLQSIQHVGNGYALNWAAMPGHVYQLLSAGSLAASWSNAPAFYTAGPVQLFMACTDAPPPSAGQKYYRVKLAR